MSGSIPGLHHVTAVSGPPQTNLDFYTGPLGQRLVKKTVNFDDPSTYHLYYGDAAASPGRLLTFFPFVDIGAGRAGPGMARAVAYEVPAGGLAAWAARLAEHGVETTSPEERFGERVLSLADPDGLRLELIEAADAAEPDPDPPAVERGFHSVTVWVADPGPTVRMLTDLFGYTETGHATEDGGERLRLHAESGGPAARLDVVRRDAAADARPGAGTVHHVAFRAETPEIHRDWRERVTAYGIGVTPVIDRQYFESIYFREPGGTLFEIATDPPGFTVDEASDALGTALVLPPQHEAHRTDIEAALPPLRAPV